MNTVTFRDTLTVEDAAPKLTREGYLVVDAKVARTGIQVYHGSEFGFKDKGDIRVYRPEEEVFKDSSLKTYTHRPVTLGHPKDQVNSKNWKKLAVGQTGDEVVRDGQSVRVPMILMDQEVIDAVRSGIKELSMGYSCELEFVDGTTPAGEPYDAIQRNLKMNHLAVVAMARGGSELRIGDDQGEPKMTDPVLKTQTVVVDGLSIQTTEQGAQALEKLQKQVAASDAARDKLVTDHAAELAKKDAEIDALKAKVIDEATLDKKVQARAQLVDTARKLYPNVVVDGRTDADIRRDVVVAKCGDELKTKDQSYIDVRFDILAEDAPKQETQTPSYQPAGYHGYVPPAVNAADQAYAESLRDINNAWMPEQPKQ